MLGILQRNPLPDETPPLHRRTLTASIFQDKAPWFLILAAILLAIVFRLAIFNGMTLTSISSYISPYSFYGELQAEGARYDQNPLLAADIERVWNPVRVMLHRQLSQGSLPLWNPAAADGMPLLAEEQTQSADPVNLLLCLLFSAPDSGVIFTFISFLLAGLWLFLLAREVGTSWYGSFISGICYMFSGPIVVWYMRPNSQTYVYLPLLLLAFEKGFGAEGEKCRRAWLLVAAVAVALILLSGHSQIAVLGLLCYGVFVGHRIGWDTATPKIMGERGRQWLIWLILPCLIGVGLAAYKVLPFAELSLQSPVLGTGRGGMLPLTWERVWERCVAGWFLLHPLQTGADLLKLFLPFFFGSPATGQHLPFGETYYQSFGENFAESASYFGILPVLFALSMLFSYRSLTVRLRSYAFCFLFGFAICYDLPIINLIRALPVLNLIKLDRLFFIIPLAGAVLAGKGFDAFMLSRPGRQLGMLVTVLVFVGTAFVGIHLAVPTWSPLSYHYYYAFIPVLVLLIAAAIVGLGRMAPAINRLLPAVLTLLIIFDSLHFAYNFMAFQPAELLHPLTVRSRLLAAYANPVYRLKYQGFFLSSFNFAYAGLLADSTFSVLQVGRHDALVKELGKALAADTPPHWGTVQTTRQPWLDVNSVGLVGVDRQMGKELAEAQQNSNLQPLYIDDDLLFFENSAALPRFSLYTNYLVVDSAAEIAAKLTSEGHDYRHTLLIDRSTPPSRVERGSGGEGGSGKIRLLHDAPDAFVLEVTTDTPSILAVTDTWYPGWQAEVDGASTPILQVNQAFRGIEVETGRHEVAMRYRPLMFRIGWLLSLGTLVLVACWWMYHARRPSCLRQSLTSAP